MTETHPGPARAQGPAQGRPAGPLAGPPGHRPTWVEVDLDAIEGNVAALKAWSRAPALLAVVKADAYGHGAAACARAALAGGADWLGVALVEEGAELRAAGIDAPILVLAEPPPRAAGALLDAGLTPAVYSHAFVSALEDAVGVRGGEPVAVHVKLDTGMRRVGVPPADWEDALRRVRDSTGLRLDGLWSHLAVADEPGHPFTAAQAQAFRRGLDLAARMGIRPRLAHLCNSAGTLTLPDEGHDMVRPGLSVYGLEPAPGLADGLGLRPALSWWARTTMVKRVRSGEGVSYGLAWTADADTTVATVCAGYADGVSRALSNRGRVLLRERPRLITGRVTMDQLLIDVGDDEVAAGEDVCLLGTQGAARVTADDWAHLLDTISYEIVCGVGQRVPRVYVRGRRAGAP